MSNKFEKDPIELLLGMGGAVQYLTHVTIDDGTYLVSVKTKTGTKQVTLPIEAVQSIQSKKPDPAIIQSIKNQLADDSSADGNFFPNPTEENKNILDHFKRWGFRLLGR